MTETFAPIRRALISVSDKTGLIELATSLHGMGIELLSTGGSASDLRAAGLPVREVADLTKFPEMMDGRVKTLHPAVHGGLLALRDNDSHLKSMSLHNIEPIDLLIVNLYPFERTVAAGADFATCVENIDIGGPAMIRAAAKNFRFVTVIVDPDDYPALLSELAAHKGATGSALRERLALSAYARTAAYDAAISNWMAGNSPDRPPARRIFAGAMQQELRYGENPHQRAAFYSDGSNRVGVASSRQIQGKALSYNNINDTDAALNLVAEFDPAHGPACAIIKHANPCGVAQGTTLVDAYRAAFNCDNVSPFGGIIAFNQRLDTKTATEISKIFTEVVIAPGADKGALEIFAQKKNLRLLILDRLPDPQDGAVAFRQVAGGFLVQDEDHGFIAPKDMKTVTKRAPSAAEMADLVFAWRVVKHVKSNAVVYVKDRATVGIGAGQMSRVDSIRIATRKAMDMADVLRLETPPTQGSVVASDAFFPFADGLLAAAEAGATAIIQPGGSMRDDEVIAAADNAGLAMVFTGMRHFRH